MPWLHRDVENELRDVIHRRRQSGHPLWMYVRGRRQSGKTQTIKRTLEHLLGPAGAAWRYSFITTGEQFAWLQPVIAPDVATDVRSAINELANVITAGVIVVLDEAQNAQLIVQQLLQHMIDTIKGSCLRGAVIIGGLILMGSRSAEMDELLRAGSAPLYARMLEHRTILPFLPYEMAELFARHGITSAKQKVFISLLSGGYPLIRQKLHRDGVLTDDAPLFDMMHALVRSDVGLVDFTLSDEFNATWRKVGAEAIRWKDDPLAQSLATKLKTSDPLSLFQILQDLEQKYGVIGSVTPLIPELRPQKFQRYRIADPRWLWYNHVFGDRRAVATGGDVHDVGVAAVTDAQLVQFRDLCGQYMETLIRDCVRYRVKRGLPGIVAWNWSDASCERELAWADVMPSLCSDPVVLSGTLLGVDAEVDGIFMHIAEARVTVVSSKLSASRLSEELRHAADSTWGCCTGWQWDKIVRKMQEVAAAPRDTDVRDLDLVNFVCDAASHDRVSLLFVTTDLRTETDQARALWKRIPVGRRKQCFFADFNDLCDFPPSIAGVVGSRGLDHVGRIDKVQPPDEPTALHEAPRDDRFIVPVILVCVILLVAHAVCVTRR